MSMLDPTTIVDRRLDFLRRLEFLAHGGPSSIDVGGLKLLGDVGCQMQFMPPLKQPDASLTRPFVICTIPKNGSTRWKQLLLKV